MPQIQPGRILVRKNETLLWVKSISLVISRLNQTKLKWFIAYFKDLSNILWTVYLPLWTSLCCFIIYFSLANNISLLFFSSAAFSRVSTLWLGHAKMLWDKTNQFRLFWQPNDIIATASSAVHVSVKVLVLLLPERVCWSWNYLRLLSSF